MQRLTTWDLASHCGVRNAGRGQDLDQSCDKKPKKGQTGKSLLVPYASPGAMRIELSGDVDDVWLLYGKPPHSQIRTDDLGVPVIKLSSYGFYI